jgi:hypothetical protein
MDGIADQNRPRGRSHVADVIDRILTSPTEDRAAQRPGGAGRLADARDLGASDGRTAASMLATGLKNCRNYRLILVAL